MSAAVTYLGQACCCLDVCINRLCHVCDREAVENPLNMMVLFLMVMQLFYYLCFVMLCQPSSDNAFIIRAAMSYRTSLECELKRLRFGFSIPLWKNASQSWMRIPLPAAVRVSIEMNVTIRSKGLHLLHATGLQASMMITGHFLSNFMSLCRSRIRSIVVPIVQATFIASIASVIYTTLDCTEEDASSPNQPLFKISARRIDANSVTIDINPSIISASLYVFVKQLLIDWHCSANDDCELTPDDDCAPASVIAAAVIEKQSDNSGCLSGVTARHVATADAIQVRVKSFRVTYHSQDARIYTVIVRNIRSHHICTHCQSLQAGSIDGPARRHPLFSARHIHIQVVTPDREGFDFTLHAADLEEETSLLLLRSDSLAST